MAALNFPNSPSLNDTHTENGVTFKWNGAAWDRLGDIGAQGAAGAAGAQGSAGAAGAQGSTGPVAGSSTQVVYKDGSNNPAGSSNLTFDGTNLTVSGNVSIGGTLTYEDVTNIDSVGLITARSGIRLGGHVLPDTNEAYDLGSADYKIRHLFLSDNSLKFVDSADVEHPLSVDGGRLKFAGGMLLGSNIQIDATSGIITSLGVKVPDDQKIFLGTGDDLQIYHNGTDSFIVDNSRNLLVRADGSGDLYLQSDNKVVLSDIGANETFIECNDNGNVSLYYDNSKKLETTTTGVTVTNDLVCDGTGDKAIRWSTSGTNKWSLYHNNSAGALVAYDNANNAERLRIDSSGNLNLVSSSSSLTDLNFTDSALNVYARVEGGKSGSGVGDLRFHTYSGGLSEAARITSDGKFGINTTSPVSLLSVSGGTSDDNFTRVNNEEVGLLTGAWGTGSSYPREVTLNGTRMDSGTHPFLRIAGQGGIKFCADLNSERMRITPSGEVNVGGSDMTQSAYTFQVSRDLGSPSASGTTLAHFRNANSTYSQNLYLKFNNSKDIIWGGGSGNGGMTWQMGTRGYNWEIGGTNKFAVSNVGATLNGTTDGVLNINTTDGRGSFIRLQENGATKVWIGSAEGMGVGDQDDACLMSVDNIYFRNSTDSRTTLTVTKEGRLSGNKAYPDASGTIRSNIYYPPTNHYLSYSAPSGGSKWLRFGYFYSRGRYRVTFNTTGGYYSPGSVSFEFQFTWSSPHVYVGNIIELGPQYLSKFRVTSNSSGSSYYAEVYVNVNSNQTNDHIHCTAQTLGTADREFNLYNYGYDLSTLTYTSGEFTI